MQTIHFFQVLKFELKSSFLLFKLNLIKKDATLEISMHSNKITESIVKITKHFLLDSL